MLLPTQALISKKPFVNFPGHTEYFVAFLRTGAKNILLFLSKACSTYGKVVHNYPGADCMAHELLTTL